MLWAPASVPGRIYCQPWGSSLGCDWRSLGRTRRPPPCRGPARRLHKLTRPAAMVLYCLLGRLKSRLPGTSPHVFHRVADPLVFKAIPTCDAVPRKEASCHHAIDNNNMESWGWNHESLRHVLLVDSSQPFSQYRQYICQAEEAVGRLMPCITMHAGEEQTVGSKV